MGIPQEKEYLLLALKMEEAMWKVMEGESSPQLNASRKIGTSVHSCKELNFHNRVSWEEDPGLQRAASSQHLDLLLEDS